MRQALKMKKMKKTELGSSAMAKKEEVIPEDQVKSRLEAAGLTHWYFESGWIRRKYNTDGWPVTLMLVNAVGFVCEAAYHHADLEVTWGRIVVKLQTHSAGGITNKDLETAKKIEQTALWRPAAGDACEGNPAKFVFHKG
jgi:4a-hydroxytetrahydrobiopterin dehydratase